MEEQTSIKGLCKLNKEILPFHGTIEILNRDKKKVYATWIIYNEQNTPIASLSKEYYNKEGFENVNNIYEMIVSLMRKYKMGRENLFLKINF